MFAAVGTVVLGLLRNGWLNRLKASNRTCNSASRTTWNDLKRLVLNCEFPGPRNLSRLVFGSTGAAADSVGLMNDAGLNHGLPPETAVLPKLRLWPPSC